MAIVAVALILLVLTTIRAEPEPVVAAPAAPVAPGAPAVITTTTATVLVAEDPPRPTSASSIPAPVDLARLRIEDRAAPGGYSRELFPTWLDHDGNGCDARDDSLRAESVPPITSGGCELTGGQWLSVYDEITVTDPSQLDVDHMVPLAEAWRSGAHAWLPEQRARFANDLDYADHLIAVTASSNRSKGDSPPNGWRPPAEASWCRYATAWVTIKVTWELTATTRERDALGQMLETC